MALVDSVADWAQVALNAGALVAGGVVWKMYFQNLKATIGTKDAEVSVARERVEYWRDKAKELEKRSPEIVERVLADRIAIRETEIEKLKDDREHGSRELERFEQELALLNRTLEQTKGFRDVLALERPDEDDPDYEDYLDYIKDREDRVVDVEVSYMGVVGVDSGQVLITDPCYIDTQWRDEPFNQHTQYRDPETGAIVSRRDFQRFDVPLEPYGKTPTELIEAGRLIELPEPPRPDTFNYSYDGACQATLSSPGYGELKYADTGEPGAGVVFQSGWGDGFYPVYGEKHDGRIVRVYVNAGADPA